GDRARRECVGGGRVTQVAGIVGALGLAALILGPRPLRLAGMAAWAAGCAGLAVHLAPSGHGGTYAAVGVAGACAAALLAWLFVRAPWTLALAVLACAPARFSVHLGSTKAHLLLPLYVVVAGAAAALAFRLARDARERELGPLAWPLALFVAWTGLSLLWATDLREGEVLLL